METPPKRKTFEAAYAALNAEQRRAVDTIDGPVMVVAGPGSGKTELLSVRVANILRQRDTGPEHILCLTFTDAAAANMRDRLSAILGSAAYRVAIHTFHSFGVEIINRYPGRFYGGAAFSAADEVTQMEILEDIMRELDQGDPLRAQHDDRFVHLGAARRAIEQLKKAGLPPDAFERLLSANREAIARIEPVIRPVFGERVSKKLFGPARAAAEKIAAQVPASAPEETAGRSVFGDPPFARQFADSLSRAIDLAEEEGTPALTAWKERYIRRGEDKQAHVADLLDMPIFESLAVVYRRYVEKMHSAGCYDYNDMILDAVAMLQGHEDIRYELQDRYQYILVDEFQDTNDAQLRLLRLVADRPEEARRPNLMVVGDDDQAIFKFQGAESANIVRFEERYDDPTVVILKSNYRSSQPILDLARRVILQGGNRLERLKPAFRKELVAARSDLRLGAIRAKEFASREAEYRWIAGEIKSLIGQGIKEKKIAVIARHHEELEAAARAARTAGIPVSYERQENVLTAEHIVPLIVMARFVDSIMRKSPAADELLPEILSFPFWGVDRSAVWEVSVRAAAERKPWLLVMREIGGELKAIADFFIDLGARARHETAEEILHALIGAPAEEGAGISSGAPPAMVSPFRTYYFGADRFKRRPDQYLGFLSALRSLIRALREYRPGQPVSVADLVAFFDLHVKNRIPISNTSRFSDGRNAAQFMTAHGAKGLEFEAVFVLDCENDVWSGAGWRRELPLPANVPAGPGGDNRDDQLRLFYVAMTRAERLLYFTASRRDLRGRDADRLAFLAAPEGAEEWIAIEAADVRADASSMEDAMLETYEAPSAAQPPAPRERELLEPVLERYQLSVTHLQNFLDIVSAGPRVFFERNLLRFPSPKSAAAGFGSAIHDALSRISVALRENGRAPELADVVGWFEEYLALERLNAQDFERMRKHGRKILEAYYPQRQNAFSPADVVEFDFRNQGVVLGEARLDGKVDRMTPAGSRMAVCDYKTGHVLTSWDGGDLYEKIRAWKYRQQIVFYKLLIEHSRDFGATYTVAEGLIEFVEPHRGRIIDLPVEITAEETERLQGLIVAVYPKIRNLDFPNIDRYPKDIRGIRMFEDDLLSGKA